MTDHLPECRDALIPDFENQRWICICPALRACEQRVHEAEGPRWLCTACWHREDGHTCERIERCMCRDCNYAAGLDAAREAVAAMVIETVGNSAATVDQALAVIDALRGES